MKIKYKFHDISSSIYLGRDDTAQTCDFLVPNQAFYLLNYISNLFYLFFFLFSFHFRIAIFPDTYAPPIGSAAIVPAIAACFVFPAFASLAATTPGTISDVPRIIASSGCFFTYSPLPSYQFL